ncbi:MAG TPA: Maf family protein, partial [bacterium]|nr:Maf family protein [bacterium]
NGLDFYDKKIVLASKSPRRKDILNMIGLDFEIQPSNYKEEGDDDKNPQELAVEHSLAKSRDVAAKFDDAWIIGADTIVVLGNEILEKPKNKKDAINMLKKLSDNTHRVITGYTILNSANQKYLSSSETTKVTFLALDREEIEFYVNNYTYEDKAGSYAIQDFSAIFVKEVNGCFYNVVGFPISAFFNLAKNKLAKCL